MDQYDIENPLLREVMKQDSKKPAEQKKEPSAAAEFREAKQEIGRHTSYNAQANNEELKLEKHYSEDNYKAKRGRRGNRRGFRGRGRNGGKSYHQEEGNYEDKQYYKKQPRKDYIVYVPKQKAEAPQQVVVVQKEKKEEAKEIYEPKENKKEEAKAPPQESQKPMPKEEIKEPNQKLANVFGNDNEQKNKQKRQRFNRKKRNYDKEEAPSSTKEWNDYRGQNAQQKKDAYEKGYKPSEKKYIDEFNESLQGTEARKEEKEKSTNYNRGYRGGRNYKKESFEEDYRGNYDKRRRGRQGRNKYNKRYKEGREYKEVREYKEEDIQKGLQEGTMIEGEFIRMYRYNKNSFIKTTVLAKDILVTEEDQHNAMAGDKVLVLLKSVENWKKLVTEEIVSETVEEEHNEKEELQKIAQKTKEDEKQDEEDSSDEEEEKQNTKEEVKETEESKKEEKKKTKKKNNEKNTKIDEAEIQKLKLHQEAYSKLPTAAEKIKYIKDNLTNYQPTGKIIKILEKVEMTSDQLCTLFSTSCEFSARMNLFALPSNRQLPVMKIGKVPNSYIVDLIKKDNPHLKYYICKYTRWSSGFNIPDGEIVRSLGNAGQINIETERIMRQFRMLPNMQPHSDLAIAYAEKYQKNKDANGNVIISPDELKERVDFRDRRVFTVDPETCRDVDDAVHIKKIDDNDFEVGVHIADVSHYIEEGSILDKEAMNRSTSIYFPHKVFKMLPTLLTEDLCSLNQGVDRFCFSVVAHLDKNGEVKLPKEENVKYFKGIIRSRAKWFYELVQDLVDGKTTSANIPKEKIPVGCTLEELVSDTKMLYDLALKRREERMRNGMFTLEKKQFTFHLNPISCLPDDFIEQKRIGTKYMIEELMLLANRLVAEKIHENMKTNTVLRVHRDFEQKDRIEKKLKALGLKMSMKTQKTINDSLIAIRAQSETKYFCTLQKLLLSLKPAEYIISHDLEPAGLAHFALNFPLYTHFTSPIRRYPDIIAHRMLFASLKYGKDALSNSKVDYSIAVNKCSANYKNGKKIGDYASKLFIALYFKQKYENKEQERFTGYVIEVQEGAMIIYVKELDIMYRIPFSERKSEIQSYEFNEEECSTTLILYQDNARTVTKVIKLFDIIPVYVTIQEKLPLELKVGIFL